LAVGTDFARFTNIATGSAVFAIIVGIDTEIAAFGEAYLTGDLTETSGTNFTGFTGIIALSAV
jgi:hypothetical protein